MPIPDPEGFAALARSSPWRWTALRFTVRWPGDRFRTEVLRAWLRRPDRLRVETVDGELVQVVRESRGRGEHVGASGERPPIVTPWWSDPGVPEPPRRADGLVAARTDWYSSRVCYDAPMYRDYQWVAMLDPRELADGCDPDGDVDVAPARPGTTIEDVVEVDHAGRPAWQAIVRPLREYAPRCTCCALLRSREIDLAEAESGGGHGIVLAEYPEAYRVRLDVETGVCVSTEAIGGPTPGAGLVVRIEAVDEPMGAELFASRGRARPTSAGWAPYPGD